MRRALHRLQPVAATTATAATLLALALLAACATPPTDCRSDTVYAGSDAGAVHALVLDACNGTLRGAGAVAAVDKPRWLLAHPQLPRLYVASDNTASNPPNGGGQVLAYTRQAGSAALQPLNAAPAGGGSTTQLWLDLSSATLLVANFANGTTRSLALQPDGQLGNAVSTLAGAGTGPHRRQNGPHVHGVALDPTGRWALTADLGADRLFVRRFDRRTRQLADDDANPPRSLALPPGSGPRHFVFDAAGRHVYLLNELSADITVLGWDAEAGHLSPLQTVPLSRPDFTGTKSGSSLVLSADGRFLYAGERGEHHVVVFAVQADSGQLSLLQRMPSGGEAPWALALQPQGQWLLVANQRSNRIHLFSVDRGTGRLNDSGQSIALQSPVSLAFIPD